jgi:tetratricopeptide (TPR) repeat protein
MVAASLLAGTPQLRAQTSVQNNQARSLFLEGCDLWDDGKFVDAERKFRDALNRYPKAEQSDRTSYYLITTLIQLGRADEARAEILNFYKLYPQSTWRSDVEEKRLMLSEPSRTAFRGYQAAHGFPLPTARYRIVMPPNSFPVNVHIVSSPSLEQEQLRIIVQSDANKGIAVARERLKVNPSDPVVISNFGTIAVSGSPQAFPFFVVVAGRGPSPHTRDQARFWIGRLKNDNDAVGKGLVEIVKEKDGVPIVAEVFSHINPAATLNVLNQIIQVPSVEKLDALEKIYKSATVQPVRSQIVQSAGSMPEPAARDFLTEVAKTEHDVSIRLAAIHTLSMRPDVDVKTLEDILKTLIGKVPAKAGWQTGPRGDTREFQTRQLSQER